MKKTAGRPLAFRLLIGGLVFVLLILQGRLWISEEGFSEVQRLNDQVELQRAENEKLGERNQRLGAEVEDLQEGFGAVEERARSDLGLIGKDESFYVFSEDLVQTEQAD